MKFGGTKRVICRKLSTLTCFASIMVGAPPAPALTADDVNCGNCVDTGDLANSAITDRKIKNKAVTNAKIKKNAVRSKHIKNGQVKRTDLADDAVDGSKVEDASLTSADLAAGSVGASELQPGAVGTSALQAGAVTALILDPSLTGGPENVIQVAKSGGDFNSVVAALDSTGDASASNRYLVRVGPGV